MPKAVKNAVMDGAILSDTRTGQIAITFPFPVT
jgi:hypothetical protein